MEEVLFRNRPWFFTTPFRLHETHILRILVARLMAHCLASHFARRDRRAFFLIRYGACETSVDGGTACWME
ncbi:hypothetical protein [Caballeronia sp. NK8]|uniref:hypothetical protein n=1 Tax=Caballeronia sp. NK8 TaxID=140098 RepID=UPI001BCA81B3|nr:hypothetical protein [Caballeronia sp. NK8]